ncbi:DUF2147 domain-containing protein [Spirosoma soli]|uniref:DUF2147 domain-containing protein n=1 Tax=Spirosoma soli TaxID=1770529 RepID=A0ABW5M9R0_9BACT
MNVPRTTYGLLFVVLILTSFAPKADNPGALVGKWLSSKKRNQVQIYEHNGKYHGRLIWMAEPIDPVTRKPKQDSKNPDEKLRSRQLLNLTMMTNFVYKGNNVWSDGEVYNPEDGKTYSCQLTLKDPNTLDVHGYILGMPFLGKSKLWTRVK